MHALSTIILVTVLFLPTVASSEVQTFIAKHTYILGDHDSKDDARQRCLLEAKRKVLEQAGVYIESASEVKDFALTKDKITSFAVAVMQVKSTQEKFGFENGHMTMTVTIKADVDLAELRKQLASRQADEGVRDKVEAQQERLKRIEAQLEGMQQQRPSRQAPGQTSELPGHILTAADVQMLKTQAVQGDAGSQSILGVLYDNGYVVPQDYAQARKWYEKAAAQGDPWAQNNLGFLYFKGNGVPQDFGKARRWFEKAAAQGNRSGQNNLAVLYSLGQGVPEDYGKARHWYEKAAAQGHANSQFSLGALYFLGKGVPEDYARARQWFEKAAAQGDVNAKFFLGMLFEDGKGVPKDPVRAYMWYSLAALSSTDGSMDDDQKLGEVRKNRRDFVAHRMTADQVAEGQRLMQQCQAQQFKGC